MGSYKVANDVPHDQWHWTVLVMWPIKIHKHTHVHIYLWNCNFLALPHEQMTKMSFTQQHHKCICCCMCMYVCLPYTYIIMGVRLSALPTDKITLRARSNSTLSHRQPAPASTSHIHTYITAAPTNRPIDRQQQQWLMSFLYGAQCSSAMISFQFMWHIDFELIVQFAII